MKKERRIHCACGRPYRHVSERAHQKCLKRKVDAWEARQKALKTQPGKRARLKET